MTQRIIIPPQSGRAFRVKRGDRIRISPQNHSDSDNANLILARMGWRSSPLDPPSVIVGPMRVRPAGMPISVLH